MRLLRVMLRVYARTLAVPELQSLKTVPTIIIAEYVHGIGFVDE